ncbi:MAG: hypothetical protein ACXVXN_12780 [Mycobacteriaceae bacterium]
MLVEVGVAGTAGAVVSGVVEGVRRAGEVGAGTAVSRVVVRPGAPGVSCGNGEVVTCPVEGGSVVVDTSVVGGLDVRVGAVDVGAM